MVPEEKKAKPERELTDASLLAERRNTDEAMAETLIATEEDADEVVDRARNDADAVLSVARDRADRKLAPAESRPEIQKRNTIARERAVEDDVVRDERATADETLRLQREEQVRVLASLLPLEREKTDRYLLTERARSDDAIERRDDFLGIVSHDLRNLLSGIVLSANVLKETVRTDDGGGTRAEIQRIQRYAARMNRLIGDLVDIVSIDGGKLEIRCQRADARPLLAEAVDAFATAAADKGVALVSESDEHPLLACFDHDRVFQVLANLVTNALKFTPRGGRICVRGERSGRDLHLCVRDTGCGITSNLLEAVFERFWQFGKNDRRGLGLGLYISKCIVEAHGGRIWVESVAGEGSEFHLVIPEAPTSPDLPAR